MQRTGLVGKQATQLINSCDQIICEQCHFCKKDDDATAKGKCQRGDEDTAEPHQQVEQLTTTSKKTSDESSDMLKIYQGQSTPSLAGPADENPGKSGDTVTLGYLNAGPAKENPGSSFTAHADPCTTGPATISGVVMPATVPVTASSLKTDSVGLCWRRVRGKKESAIVSMI